MTEQQKQQMIKIEELLTEAIHLAEQLTEEAAKKDDGLIDVLIDNIESALVNLYEHWEESGWEEEEDPDKEEWDPEGGNEQ